MWNLNKMNKGNKTGQSHRHREQADSCQKVGRWGKREEEKKKRKEKNHHKDQIYFEASKRKLKKTLTFWTVKMEMFRWCLSLWKSKQTSKSFLGFQNRKQRSRAGDPRGWGSPGDGRAWPRRSGWGLRQRSDTHLRGHSFPYYERVWMNDLRSLPVCGLRCRPFGNYLSSSSDHFCTCNWQSPAPDGSVWTEMLRGLPAYLCHSWDDEIVLEENHTVPVIGNPPGGFMKQRRL